MTLTARDLWWKCVRFEPNGRPLFLRLTWLMPGVIEDWLATGVPQAEIDLQLSRCDRSPEPIDVVTGAYPPFEATVLEETDQYVVTVNDKGGKSRLQKGYIGYHPVPIEYPVHTVKDWERLKPRFRFTPERLPPGWAERARGLRAEGVPIRLDFDGYYWFLRGLMGDEQVCLALFDRPQLIHDVNETLCELTLDVADALAREDIVPDTVHFPEDIAWKGGPIISPRHFREYLLPYYRRVADRLRGLGVPHLEVDSDGCVEDLIPLYLEAGINGLMPFECQAGMDIVNVRAKYGKDLVIAGGIDKHIATRGRRAIDTELAYKLPPMITTGGYTLMTDHRMVRGSPFDDFVYYVDQVRHYLGISD